MASVECERIKFGVQIIHVYYYQQFSRTIKDYGILIAKHLMPCEQRIL